MTRSNSSKPELVVVAPAETYERERADDRPQIGSWWWLSSAKNDDDTSDDDDVKERDKYDRPKKQWLACVVELGSNYAKVEGVRWSRRVALDHFYEQCKPEPKPQVFIDEKLALHKTRVRELMAEIQHVCHLLGVPLRQALDAPLESSTQALAIAHGVDDVKKHKNALVKAKEKTLPELFEKVKEEHAKMAKWMNAELIPAKADLASAQTVTERIEAKIHTVELYAGLCEELVQIKKGKPASVDTKVCLMQRRLYMDEECLLHYEAGGMRFDKIGDFDKWLAKPEHFARIFPRTRCIVAFRVRRFDHHRTGEEDIGSIEDFIRFAFENAALREADRSTFLYIRNGEQLWRMETELDFEEELFPKQEDNELLNNEELWIKESEYAINHDDGVITNRQRDARILERQRKRDILARRMWAWHRLGKPEGKWRYRPLADEHDFSPDRDGTRTFHGMPPAPGSMIFQHDLERDVCADYVRLEPTSIYFDDVMKRIAKTAAQHNRVAVIVQGLLDRSTCLHPHPPWRIWTAEGFAAGIELIYDVARALVPTAEPPSWQEYRAQLNKSLRPGCHTIGQRAAWVNHMIDKYGHNWRRYSSISDGDGPGRIDHVESIRGKKATFAWMRERSFRNPVWVPAERPGYRRRTYPDIRTTWSCPIDELTCVDGYTPGDFHLFFDDPRTREKYIQWAPTLLMMENWHHKRRNPTAKKRSDDDDT